MKYRYTAWSRPRSVPALRGDCVHLWRVSLEQPVSQLRLLAQTLSPDEMLRAEGFYFERDRNRYIAGRGLLRTVLGAYLGVEPRSLNFRYSSTGKPALLETPGVGALSFNLSHSRELVLIALTRGREIGVDLEYIRPIREIDRVSERVFPGQDNERFRTLSLRAKHTVFFKCWTRKEAYLKACGAGLIQPWAGLEVSMSPEEIDLSRQVEDPRLPSHSSHPSHWSIQTLMVACGYVASLAIEGPNWHLKCWQWTGVDELGGRLNHQDD